MYKIKQRGNLANERVTLDHIRFTTRPDEALWKVILLSISEENRRVAVEAAWCENKQADLEPVSG